MTTRNDTSIRSALFVDFDNIFITLSEQDADTSNAFASNPERWLLWLQNTIPAIQQDTLSTNRRLLIRKCYLNPQAFGHFRPFFIRSAFEVVDCPPLTSRGKTSTDIHMVMDILDTLHHATWIHEFMILSGDADFTPVLLRLRAHDRYSIVLSTGYVSPAYKAASDYVITQEDFIRDALGIIEQEDEEADVATDKLVGVAASPLLKRIAERLHGLAVLPTGISANNLPSIYKEFVEFRQSTDWLGFYSLRRLTQTVVNQHRQLQIIGDDPWCVVRTEYTRPPAMGSADTASAPLETIDIAPQDIKQAIATWVTNIVETSAVPVTMASLAQGVMQEFRSYLEHTSWLQAGTFKNLLLELKLSNLEISNASPGFVYSPQKHLPPTSSTQHGQLPVDTFSAKYPEVAPLARNIHILTDTPYLMPEHYALLLSEIARAVNESGFQITQTSKLVRDRCVEKGGPISRAHVNFVLNGIYNAGHRLGTTPPERAEELSQVLIGNTINLCRNSQLVLSEEDIELMRQWIRAES